MREVRHVASAQGAGYLPRDVTEMKLVVVDDLLVSVSRAGSEDKGVLNQRDMAHFLDVLRTAPIKRYLACMHGSFNSSSVQRKEGADLIKSRDIEVAVITDDRLVRGIVTALSWLGARVSAFSWADIGKSLEHLRLDGEQAKGILGTIGKFRWELGIPS
jgi:hypothetical protein